jgi:D-inositol-3-phosphate glycosyltransferase
VVATAVGGLAHIVADGVSGFLLEARDPSIFAARLKTLLADKKLSEKFRVNAIERARVFSWDRAATELLDLYECLRNEQYPELCTC